MRTYIDYRADKFYVRYLLNGGDTRTVESKMTASEVFELIDKNRTKTSLVFLMIGDDAPKSLYLEKFERIVGVTNTDEGLFVSVRDGDESKPKTFRFGDKLRQVVFEVEND